MTASGRSPADEARLARLIANIVENDRFPGDRVMTLGEEQQVRRRAPVAPLLWAGLGLAALAVAAAILLPGTGHRAPPPSIARSLPARPIAPSPTVTATPEATRPTPPPTAYLAEVQPRREPAPPRSEPVAPQPEATPTDPGSDAYSPQAAEPLSGERLRMVLIEDHRRTRELNAKQLDALRAPDGSPPDD